MKNDDIDAILRSKTNIKPDEQTQQRAVDVALARYDEINLRKRQGMPFFKRLNNETSNGLQFLFGELHMKKTYIVTGGICLVLLGAALLNTSNLAQIVPIPSSDTAMIEPSTQPADASVLTRDTDSAPELHSLNAPVELKEEVSAMPVEKAARRTAPAAKSALMVKPEMAREATASAPPAPVAARNQTRGQYAPPAAANVADDALVITQPSGRDNFASFESNSVKQVQAEPVSTFSIDVDTASYAYMRSAINQNQLPQKDAVRVEELINYFSYDYPLPKSAQEPFTINTTLYPSPWNSGNQLLHIGIQGYAHTQAERPAANLVFLLDTSGSMRATNKLPLVQNSLKLMLDSLQPEDRVAIVTYAGQAGTLLEPTAVKDKAKITQALNNLYAGGSTAGAAGIRQAYALAQQHFDADGINRVILATDGDFNVGITNQNELKGFIERKRDTGIYLSILGFGRGNYNDALMQTLAQNGNGNASYIDNLNEARKILVEEAGSTLFSIAKDVKIQVEFNPLQIDEYRLIGYENRQLAREDFNNDAIDAAEIGSGHSVTAIYEITPVGSKAKLIDDLRYQPAAHDDVLRPDAEIAHIKLRYKLPDASKSTLMDAKVAASSALSNIEQAPADVQFATAVAAFGQVLRGAEYMQPFSYDDIVALAQPTKGDDNFGYRSEFINLLRLAKHAQP